MAEHLPRDSYLTSFRAEGDSIVMEGQAPRASRVFDALRGVPGITGVRVAAPVRRDFPEGGAPVERFVLSARLGASSASNAPPRLPAQAGPDAAGADSSRAATGSGATEATGSTASTGSAAPTGEGAPR
ncbi:MAG TPA: PilN domain-containing protein [Longimicrobium sp.]|nr:PilN domain-containing protein [Longimicrobium sp.]